MSKKTSDKGKNAWRFTYKFNYSLVAKRACSVDLIFVLGADIVMKKVIEEVTEYPDQVFDLVFTGKIKLTSQPSRSVGLSMIVFSNMRPAYKKDLRHPSKSTTCVESKESTLSGST